MREDGRNPSRGKYKYKRWVRCTRSLIYSGVIGCCVCAYTGNSGEANTHGEYAVTLFRCNVFTGDLPFYGMLLSLPPLSYYTPEWQPL